MPGDLNMFRFMIMSTSSLTMSKASKGHWSRTFNKCKAKLATAFPTPFILRMIRTPMRFYLTLTSLTQDGEGIMVDVSVTWKCVCSFSMWTRSKWNFGWRSNLMDEELYGFGFVESAKARDNWSSWGIEGAVILHLLCFLFLWFFVACRWSVLFLFFHGCDDDRRWSYRNHSLFWSFWLMECEHYNIWRSFQLMWS